jgi:hypothetical protein
MKPILFSGRLIPRILFVLGFSLAQGLSQTNDPCAPPPAGIIAWWPAEGNATDIIGGGTGTLYPSTNYADGVVGRPSVSMAFTVV